MCFAIPGKIIEIKGDIATVDYGGEQRKAKLAKNFKMGDYVLVSAGLAIQKVPEKEARESLKLFKK